MITQWQQKQLMAPVNVMPQGGEEGLPWGIWPEKSPWGRGSDTDFCPHPHTRGVFDIENGRKPRSASWGFWHDVISLGLGIWCDNFFVSESLGLPLLPSLVRHIDRRIMETSVSAAFSVSHQSLCLIMSGHKDLYSLNCHSQAIISDNLTLHH